MTKKSLLIASVFILAFAGLISAGAADRHTKNGAFIFQVQMEPSDPVVGSNKVLLAIRDAGSGAAVEGAVVKMVPYMSMHGHGSPKTTTVKEKGKGIYEVDDIYYSMEGPWELLMSIQKGTVRDAASVAVDIKK